MYVDVVDEGHQRLFIRRTDTARVEGGVRLPHEVEEKSDSQRQVQVVVERLAISAAHCRDLLPEPRVIYGARHGAVDTLGELTQPPHLLRGGMQRFCAQSQPRSVVGVGDQEIPDGQRIVSGGDQVAKRRETARAL